MLGPLNKNLTRRIQNIANYGSHLWGYCNHLIIKYICRTKIHIHGQTNLSNADWYLLISNHCSAADIPILYSVFNKKLPPFKFFLKQELLYMPLLGSTCWTLGMPFINRKKSQSFQFDFNIFKTAPCTIINFVEGSRVNSIKIKENKSPYSYLLKPKFLGILSTLLSLKNEIKHIVDVTIIYRDLGLQGKHKILLMLFCGDLKDIDIQIKLHDSPQCLQLTNEKQIKVQFKHWINDLWKEKDQWIHQQKTAAS